MADAADSKSAGVNPREGSSPSFGTTASLAFFGRGAVLEERLLEIDRRGRGGTARSLDAALACKVASGASAPLVVEWSGDLGAERAGFRRARARRRVGNVLLTSQRMRLRATADAHLRRASDLS